MSGAAGGAGATMAAVTPPPAAPTRPGGPVPAGGLDGDEDVARRGAAATVGRVLVVVIVLGSLLLWVYVFSGVARKDPPNTLDDAAFGVAAEPICAEAAATLATLPRAEDSTSAAQRADVIDDANGTLTEMVDRLDELEVSTARDREMTDEWISDWRTFIDDRADFAARLREDDMARFYVTEKPGRLQVTKAIDDLAEVNDMPSCVDPGDVG